MKWTFSFLFLISCQQVAGCCQFFWLDPYIFHYHDQKTHKWRPYANMTWSSIGLLILGPNIPWCSILYELWVCSKLKKLSLIKFIKEYHFQRRTSKLVKYIQWFLMKLIRCCRCYWYFSIYSVKFEEVWLRISSKRFIMWNEVSIFEVIIHCTLCTFYLTKKVER